MLPGRVGDLVGDLVVGDVLEDVVGVSVGVSELNAVSLVGIKVGNEVAASITSSQLRTLGVDMKGRNYVDCVQIVRNCMDHTHIGRNYICHTYIGGNYIGHL